MRNCLSLLGVAVAAVIGAAGCTDVTENFPPGGCEKDQLRCIGGDLAKCNEAQTEFTIIKVCAEDSPCTGTPPNCDGADIGGGKTCEAAADCTLGDVGPCRVAICDAGTCAVAKADEGADCNDSNACTEATTCDAEGVCRGTEVTCDDEDQCTTDSCDQTTGCVFASNEGAACDDTKPCTNDDVCTDGTCAGVVECDDQNQCTSDFCDVAGVCQHTPDVGACDDDDTCTKNDKCVAGACEGEPDCECNLTLESDCDQYNADDPCKGEYFCEEQEEGNPIGLCVIDQSTALQCPPAAGDCEQNKCVNDEGVAKCETTAKPNGDTCSDGTDCTSDDVCTDGACIGALDITIPGCGFFKLGWYTLSSETAVWDLPDYRLIGTVSYPQIHGTAENNQYRVRAIGPEL